jgi:hypothetical protein
MADDAVISVEEEAANPVDPVQCADLLDKGEATQNASLPEGSVFDLSSALTGVCDYLGSLFDLSPCCVLTKCLVAAGTALGNRVRLRSPFFPRSVNAALDCILCDDQASRLGRAFEFLISPLVLDDASVRETTGVELGELERGPVLVANPEPGELVRMIGDCADHCLLAVYDDYAIGQALDQAKDKAAQDLRLITAGRTGASFTLPKDGARQRRGLVSPAISCVISCRRETLARLLGVAEPPLDRFIEPFFTVPVRRA